ncbi:hypothetical protein GGQ74_000204 [Desulfobaculum xiamenense]|uniref:Uncharacterized protein n=1 Tax=Desulfobaculum xiamenense TaxID=995050 RepID=A0A846QMU7_9BACT|nr:hypothetical protein [Desulfobaculum xiamenense]NJB66564.1 hypothetical protein [Desulfobaculum xiamenense]
MTTLRATFSFGTTQVIFLGLIIAMDFSLGMILKNVLEPTGLLAIVRVDLVVPVMLVLLTRLIIDRFGTLIVYELVFATLAMAAMPASYGLPGPLKLIPALAQGLTYDVLLSALAGLPRARLYAAAILGGIVSTCVLMLLKVALGMPWFCVTKVLFGTQMATSLAVNALGAWLALRVWQRIGHTHLVAHIGAQA